MNEYIDLILTEDGAVLIAPKFSYIEPGQVVECCGEKLTVVDAITINTSRDEYRFICGMEPNIPRAEAVWTKKELVWDAE